MSIYVAEGYGADFKELYSTVLIKKARSEESFWLSLRRVRMHADGRLDIVGVENRYTAHGSAPESAQGQNVTEHKPEMTVFLF